MKKLVGFIAVGFLVGCGGPEVDVNASGDEAPVASVEQGICEGFNNGARVCSAKCGGSWYSVGVYPGIDSGGCGAAADSYCRYWFGTGSSGACWSY